MHMIRGLSAQWLRHESQYLDPESKEAEQRHARFANGYQHIRQFMDSAPVPDLEAFGDTDKPLKWRGGHNWLGHFGPIHRRTDGKKRPMTSKAFVAYCRAGARDKYGRRRKRVAYRGVLNPPNLMQYALRDLCLRAPQQANSFFLHAFAFLRRRLRKEFPGAPLQLAFHCEPGRAHWEFIIPKYNERNRKVRPGVRLDGPDTSIAHAEAIWVIPPIAFRARP